MARDQFCLHNNAGICQMDQSAQTLFKSKRNNFHSRKCIWIYRLQKGGKFVAVSYIRNICAWFFTMSFLNSIKYVEFSDIIS